MESLFANVNKEKKEMAEIEFSSFISFYVQEKKENTFDHFDDRCCLSVSWTTVAEKATASPIRTNC